MNIYLKRPKCSTVGWICRFKISRNVAGVAGHAAIVVALLINLYLSGEIHFPVNNEDLYILPYSAMCRIRYSMNINC